MSRKISCIVTDDEPLARRGLVQYISKIDFLQCEGECEDALQLSNRLIENPVDLVFLDIEMPFLSGAEWLRQATNPPRVIFTTAYEHYALEGFQLDVLDYLLKPVSFERFFKAANKAREYFQLLWGTTETRQDYFFVKADGRFEKVMLNEILFVEAMENYMCIHTSGRKLMVLMTQKALLEILPPDSFLQIHKSFVISLQQVTAIDNWEVLIGQNRIPISRTYRDEFFRLMNLTVGSPKR
jgi:DNA-binding LytR/AlgR family response regulator